VRRHRGIFHISLLLEPASPMAVSGVVSRVSPVQTAMRNCTRDEGRSFEVGNQLRSTSQVLPAAMSLPHNLLSDLFAGNADFRWPW
jgi:hypothetical protein